jgi:hypothetical protein
MKDATIQIAIVISDEEHKETLIAQLAAIRV